MYSDRIRIIGYECCLIWTYLDHSGMQERCLGFQLFLICIRRRSYASESLPIGACYGA